MRRMDGVLAGTMAGMAATLVKDVPNYSLYRLGWVKLTYWHLAASVFVAREDIGSPLALVVGAAADIIVGGVLGMVLLLIFRHFGRDLWWYKGFVAGNAIWLFGSGLGVGAFCRLVPLDPIFRLSSLAEHQLYGLTAAFLIWHWTRLEQKRG
ncbi:MAG: hypothetical protein ACM3ZC_08165 [Bacteroidota bacterium]